jgi:hypothetical protein
LAHFSIAETMNRKTALTSADLFVLLDREFRRRRPRECGACEVQLPYLVQRPGGAANWESLVSVGCARGCSNAFEDLLAEFQRLYDLKPEMAR